MLQLKQLGVKDVLGFDFMDRPPVSALLRALELLFALGALDSQGDLTEPLGKHMVRLPLEPIFAKVCINQDGPAAFSLSARKALMTPPAGQVLLSGVEMGCTEEAMMVVAIASTDPVLLNTRCWFALAPQQWVAGH